MSHRSQPLQRLWSPYNTLKDVGLSRCVSEFERQLSLVEELEAVVSANLKRASSLRQSILRKAFTGELV